MKFYVRQNEINTALNVLKTSKALGKPDEELLSIIKIEVYEESGKNRVRFTATNTVAWASSSITTEQFEGLVGDQHPDFFGVEEYDTLFVDGHSLINVIGDYPDNSIIHFSIKKRKKGDGEISNLVCESYRNNKKEKKKSTFLVKIPTYFQESPPDESRETIEVPARELADAVCSVEFASSNDDKQREFWGVFTEIKDNEVSCCATDKTRVCWYDRNGLNGQDTNDHFSLCPIKTFFVAALKGLDLHNNVTVERGEKFTILKQDNQWQAVPNVTKTAQVDDGSEFDWRSVAKRVSGAMESSINIPRKTLLECVKLSTSASGKDFSIKIHFDTSNKKALFAVEKIEGGGVVCSHEEEISLDDSQFDSDINQLIVLTLDSIKDIVSKYSGDFVTFRIKDNDMPIEILSEKDYFRFITGTVDPPNMSSGD